MDAEKHVLQIETIISAPEFKNDFTVCPFSEF